MSNFDPSIWGPLIWNIIHIISNRYKKTNQKHIIMEIYKYYIPNILPCHDCRHHYRKFIKKQFFYSQSFKYQLYNFHQSVTNRIKKEDRSYCKECYDKKYSNFCCSDVEKNINKLINYYYSINANNYVKELKMFLNFLNNNKSNIYHR